MPDPDPEEVSWIVDALLAETGIVVEPEAPRSASFQQGPSPGSDAVRDFLKKDEPVLVPKLAPAHERFAAAIDTFAKNGKVKGQVTKGEAQKALRALDELNADEQRDVVKALLAGEMAAKLSKGARELLDEIAASSKGWMAVVAERQAKIDD